MSSTDGDGPGYDAGDAVALLGKTVLMAVAYRGCDGSLVERQQLHGTIISVDKRAGGDDNESHLGRVGPARPTRVCSGLARRLRLLGRH